jgi:hypothetical protein
MRGVAESSTRVWESTPRLDSPTRRVTPRLAESESRRLPDSPSARVGKGLSIKTSLQYILHSAWHLNTMFKLLNEGPKNVHF